MANILKATDAHSKLLAQLGGKTFIESHGHSAAQSVIDNYVADKYSQAAIAAELNDPANIYHLIYHDNKAVGYSKIVLNSPNLNIAIKNVTKLDRIYILKDYYHLKLGFELLQFNVNLSKQHQQSGMWLFTWKENQRAVDFYLKNGFKIIGSYDFHLTPTHANPNHQMLLEY